MEKKTPTWPKQILNIDFIGWYCCCHLTNLGPSIYYISTFKINILKSNPLWLRESFHFTGSQNGVFTCWQKMWDRWDRWELWDWWVLWMTTDLQIFNWITVKSRGLARLVLKQTQDFSDCLWREFSILRYCNILTKSWFPNYIVTRINIRDFRVCNFSFD